jgi:surface protein
MERMFYNCKSLSMIDIRNFDTSNAKNMWLMLGGLGANNNLNIFLGEKFNTINNNAGLIFENSTISAITFTGNLPNLSDDTFSGVGTISNPAELVVPSQYAANYASQIGTGGKFYGGYFKLAGYTVDTSMPEPNVGTKRLIAITRQREGNNLERTDMTYDEKGRIVNLVYSNGTRTKVGNYKYDNDVISIVYDNSFKHEFHFANGKISTAPMNLESEGLTGTRYFEYDASDQLVKFSIVIDGSSNNTYAKVEWNNGSPSSVYYANLNTSTNTETEMYSASFTQNGMSAEPVVRALFGLCVSTPTFDISDDIYELIAFYPYIGKLPQQLIGQAEHSKSGKVSVYNYSYETDNNGNITKVTITCDGKATVYTLEWEGSSTPPSTDITASETGKQDFGNGGGIDSNTNLNGNVVGNVYYNIASGGGGYNAVEGCIEITKPTDDSAIEGKDIFGEDFKNHFTGIVFKVAAGKGTIKVNAQAAGSMKIKVKVGSNDPYEMALTGKVEAKFPYNVTEPTYVFVYASIFTGSAPGRASAAGSDVLRIYGLSWDDTAGIDELNSDASRDTPVYNLRGQRLAAPQKGINIVGGRKVVVK